MPAEPSSSAPTWGRYVPLRRVGRGATGIVYAAFDPILERQVAVKVVRPNPSLGESTQRATTRLIRESRALAALSAPNVLSIYDVGETGGQVYIVTELVRGMSLRRWLGRTRTPAEIIARFVEAGRGLAAAHRAGIVHRDFKPSNVMLGEDGRVQVLDFGLAQRRRSPKAESPMPGGLTASEERLTATGEAVGTPSYMSPERLVGLSAGPLSDQFAFCVALWEALAMRHPFPAGTLSGIAKRIATSVPVGDPVVGARVRAALLRGMSVRPSQRHPDMDALVRALTRATRPRWGRRAVAGATVLIAGAAALPALASLRAGRTPCGGASEEMAASWNDQVRADVSQALTQTPVLEAREIAESVTAQLDAFSAQWVAMHTEACEATTVEATQSATVMDLRMGCLHRTKDALDAAVAVLRQPDPEIVRRSPTIVDGLPPIAACSNISRPAPALSPLQTSHPHSPHPSCKRETPCR